MRLPAALLLAAFTSALQPPHRTRRPLTRRYNTVGDAACNDT